MKDPFRISLSEAFDGPLDLLLHLVSRHEIDIFDIPIAYITERYLEYMQVLSASGGLDMEVLSEFILMAATLLQIKARMLLPEEKPESGEEPEDPRTELADRLMRYKIFKERAVDLAEREQVGVQALYRDRDPGFDWEAFAAGGSGGAISGLVSAERLHSIFADLLLRKDRRTNTTRVEIPKSLKERFSISERIAWLGAELRRKKRLRFLEMFEDTRDRDEVVTTFLALLEMMRQDKVIAVQEGLFDDIILMCKD
ncbi:MAG: segregation/condensation protein A [Clostridiales bacterium]|jgi:segregation and condensation protein A|nr:segregation/condensation protein A [Clostridiales bacterium]